MHYLEIYGAEGCCDGTTKWSFSVNGSNWYAFTTKNLNIYRYRIKNTTTTTKTTTTTTTKSTKTSCQVYSVFNKTTKTYLYNVYAPCYLYFDGKNDRVEVKSPKLNKLVDEYTVSAWVYPESLKGWRVIRNNKGWSKHDNHFQFKDSKLEFSLHGNAPTDVWFKMTFQENTWYHLAVTYSAKTKTANLYVNGEPVETVKYSRANKVRLEGFDIGSWGNSRRF
jgi:hypothetical protein